MYLENSRRKQSAIKTDRLLDGMWKAENIKNSLTKLSKIGRGSAQVPSYEGSFISNIDSGPRSKQPSPTRTHDNSFVVQVKCAQCQKVKNCFVLQKKHSDELQAKCKELQQKYLDLSQQKATLSKKLQLFQRDYCKTKQAIQPYQNNVNLMEQKLSAIQQCLVGTQQPVARPNADPELLQRKLSIDIEFNYLKKTHLRDQESHESKIARLSLIISHLEGRLREQETQLESMAREKKIMNGIINESAYVVQQRQLFSMACEEIYQLKLERQQWHKESESLNRFAQKLKLKIHTLTSLIGYGVVSNIQNNELHELMSFTENLHTITGPQQKLSPDISGILSLNISESGRQLRDYIHKPNPAVLRLYEPNFLVMFDERQIHNALEQQGANIIKPQFFLLVRAVLDSKYLEFKAEGHRASKFADFTYAFINFFKMKKNEKRIELNPKHCRDEYNLMRTNFLLRIFDRKVGCLPEIATFRQFLVNNTPQDQIFYYLMCRNLVFAGPELDNYINCSDAYNFVPYARVLEIAQLLLENIDVPTRSVVLGHISQKRVMKNKQVLVKSNYVLRLLLEVYRKYKQNSVLKLKMVFDQTCRLSKSVLVKFAHFREILSKNFPYLTNVQICDYYRRSVSIYHTNPQHSFFECFKSCALEFIYLARNLKQNDDIHRLRTKNTDLDHYNCMLELAPESVCKLGSEAIYAEYTHYVKLNVITMEAKMNMTRLLLRIMALRWGDFSPEERSRGSISSLIDDVNNKLVGLLNENFKRRQRYEERMEKASQLIGRECKKKIFEFYSDFVNDIHKQVNEN